MTPFNYFTVDVEEWWLVHSFRHYVTDEMADRFNDRIETGLEKLLDLLDKYNYSGTFFILGRIANKYPDIIAEIVNRGHDIGTHSYAHKLIYEQTKEEFEKDLIKSLEILEKISGSKIKKYRAPSYSIRKDTLWAIEILAKNGIEIDSSIFPSQNSRFGIKGAPRKPYKIYVPAYNKFITEFPPSVINFLGKKIPVASGFFFRIFPKNFINYSLKKSLGSDIHPMLVIHNWELDPNHPKIQTDLFAKIIHYTNIARTKSKIEFFFEKYKFSSLSSDIQIDNTISLSEMIKN